MSPSGSAATSPLPILVVEDEAPIMEFMRLALERSGYRMVPASSGEEAIKLLAGGQFLGVISDMRTPGALSGADVHAWIESHRPDLASRLIFVTGDIANENTATLLQNSGAPCIEKPFRIQELIGMVEKTFGKKP
jgi:DNA-binding NtrC family response regulator